jgi:histidinol-phosphatase (PHP family)
MIDYHTHHDRCGHAIGNLRQYVEHAIQIGVTQLGLSDHMPLIHLDPEHYLPEVAMSLRELSNYVEECYNLKAEYKHQLDIRVGLEADYIEGFEREVEQLLSQFEWDYVIGSVHFIGPNSNWDITDYRMVHRWQEFHANDVYREYYEKVGKAASSGLFDFIGHFDVIKRFGVSCDANPTEWQFAALDVIHKHDLALELNTAGWQTKAAEQYPSRALIEACHQRGIPMTIGSDAHQPAHLTRDFGRAMTLLKECGVHQFATFSQRQRLMVDF